MAFNNMSELNLYVNKVMEAMIKEVSRAILEELKNIINEHIYSAPPGEKYERHPGKGGFKEAFELDEVRAVLNMVSVSLVYNWQTMISPMSGDNGGYTHGYNGTYTDRRKDLWWILDSEYANKQYSEVGGAIGVDGSSAGYMEEFSAWLFGVGGGATSLINSICRKYGLVRR